MSDYEITQHSLNLIKLKTQNMMKTMLQRLFLKTRLNIGRKYITKSPEKFLGKCGHLRLPIFPKNFHKNIPECYRKDY